MIYDKQTILDMCRLAADLALERAGKVSMEISQSQAYLLYGESRVRTWVNKGMLNRVKSGEGRNNKVTYHRAELEALRIAEQTN